MVNKYNQKNKGFVIVELIVVLVVIGILAGVSGTAYTGIKKRAITAKIYADAKNAKTQLAMHNATHDGYPTSSDCSGADSDICFKPSPGNTITFIPGSDSSKFQLAITNNDTNSPSSYLMTESQDLSLMITWKQISAGSNHTCAIGMDDKAYCWGSNDDGRLGINETSTANKNKPTKVLNSDNSVFSDVSSISAGSNYTCAITKQSSRAYCWGNNQYGKLGVNSEVASFISPKAVSGSNNTQFQSMSKIAAGTDHTCGIAKSDNKAYCWGHNYKGQLGNNKNPGVFANSLSEDKKYPVGVYDSYGNNFFKVKDIAVGSRHTCAIGNDVEESIRRTYCWGSPQYGKVGDGVNLTNTNLDNAQNKPKQVLIGENSSIVTGDEHTCAIAESNKVSCWGINTALTGQLGRDTGVLQYTRTPDLISKGDMSSVQASAVSKISSTSQSKHTCVIADSELFCWGSDNKGQLGSEFIKNILDFIPIDQWYSFSPRKVDYNKVLNDKKIIDITAGQEHTCALDSNGWAYCWGKNDYGQIGNNATDSPQHFPVRVVLMNAETK